jgi:hypothetical protein
MYAWVPQWSLSLRFPYQNLYTPFLSPIHTTGPAHLILLDFITRKKLGEEYRPITVRVIKREEFLNTFLYSC